MKKSVVLFIVALMTFLIMDRIASKIISSTEEKILTGNSIGKINYFLKIKDSVDVLVFGSSRALHHVNTQELDQPAFNIGADGKKIAYCAGLTSMLNKKGQILMVHIDHNRVFDSGYKGQDATGLLYKAIDDRNLSSFLKSNFPTDYFISKGISCYPYNGKVLVVLKNVLVKDSINHSGYEPIYPTNEQRKVFSNIYDEDKFQMNINIHKPLTVSHDFEKYVDYIKQIAVENDSKLVFFTSPSLNKVDKEVHEKVSTFFKGKGIMYLDHLDYFENADVSLWKDYTHLSAKGADLYTKFLKNELRDRGILKSK